MKDMITQASSTKEKSYLVLDSLRVGIKVEENYYSLPLESVFAMAARNNPKRSYLFVSKLIGKHIPVRPDTPFIAGFLLASRLAQTLGLPVVQQNITALVDTLAYDRDDRDDRLAAVNGYGQVAGFCKPYHLPGRVLFVGFAETATALGHAVFSSFAGGHRYLHTTRENLAGAFDTLYFTEEHCHAPEQRCLISDHRLVEGNDVLVLIDDEITSGNTCLDIIRTIHSKYPQPEYVILTILDWRDNQALQKYSSMEQELGVQIRVLPLIKGNFWSKGASPLLDNPLAAAGGAECPVGAVHMLHLPFGLTVQAKVATGEDGGDNDNSGGAGYSYLAYTGRFGLDERQNSRLHDEARTLGQRLARRRKGKRTLCLGTGEFMYLPFLIARYMGDGVWVQSTTRSPVHPRLREDYGVKYAVTFEDPFRPGVPNYVYNIPPRSYDEVYVFWERRVLPRQVAPLVQALQRAGIPNITFIYFCE